MDAKLKVKLSVLPLLACSGLAFASQPVLLDASDMDRVTAGAQPLFGTVIENIIGNIAGASLLTPPRLHLDNWVPLTPGQLTSIKQLIANASAVTHEVTQGEPVTTFQLKPGEALQIRQTSSGGVNYAYVRSTGNASIQTIQITGLLTR